MRIYMSGWRVCTKLKALSSEYFKHNWRKFQEELEQRELMQNFL